jgi:hypothetical protein
MSYLTQFIAQAARVGDIREFPEAGASFPRGAETWSRCGSAIASSGFTQAIAEPRTMISGLAATLSNTVIALKMATNGTGTWVMVDAASATSLRVSTDHGATWAGVVHNLTLQASTVEWIQSAGRFVAFGCDNTNIKASYSANGTSGWTAGGSLTPPTTPTANSVRSATDGTIAVISWTSTASSASVVATTTNGSSLTQRSFAAAISSNTNQYVACDASLGTGRWMVISESRSAKVSTAADGSAWAAVVSLSNTSIGTVCGAAGGGGGFMVTGDAGYANSPTGATWTYRNYPSRLSGAVTDAFAPGKSGLAYPNWLSYDGTRFITGTANAANFSNNYQGKFGYTSDGINWTLRQLTYPSENIANAQILVNSAAGYLVAAHAGVATSLQNAQSSANWITNCDYVGIARPLIDSHDTGGIATSFYVKIAG